MPQSYKFSKKQRETIVSVTATTSTFSCLGALFIIILFLKFKQLRSFPFRYVFFLSLADLTTAVGFLMINDDLENQESTNFLCQLQAFFINYGELSSILWTTVIAWLLYQQILVQKIDNIQKYEFRMFIYAYATPLLMSFIPVLTSDYGKAGAWCWIKMDEDQKWKSTLLRLLEFYFPLWAAFFFNGITIYRVVKFVKQRTSDKKDQKLVNKLKFYPLILVFCWSFATVDRIANYMGLQSYTLHLINIIFGGLYGFCNATVYGLSKKVRSLLNKEYPKLCCCCEFKLKSSSSSDNLKSSDDCDPEQIRKQEMEMKEAKYKQEPSLGTNGQDIES